MFISKVENGYWDFLRFLLLVALYQSCFFLLQMPKQGNFNQLMLSQKMLKGKNLHMKPFQPFDDGWPFSLWSAKKGQVMNFIYPKGIDQWPLNNLYDVISLWHLTLVYLLKYQDFTNGQSQLLIFHFKRFFRNLVMERKSNKKLICWHMSLASVKLNFWELLRSQAGFTTKWRIGLSQICQAW